MVAVAQGLGRVFSFLYRVPISLQDNEMPTHSENVIQSVNLKIEMKDFLGVSEKSSA